MAWVVVIRIHRQEVEERPGCFGRAHRIHAAVVDSLTVFVHRNEETSHHRC